MTERTTPTVRDLIDRGAQIYEDKTFIKFVRDGKIEERSYRTTQQNALAVCRWIRSLSQSRMHVALISKTSYEYITCLTGILISGNVAIPFSPDISATEATKLLERADVDLLLFENEFSDKAAKIKEGYPGLKYAVNIGDESYFNHIYQTYDNHSKFASLSDFEVEPDDCACMIYTSGTTGVRKGVMLSTNALVGNIMYHDYSTDIFNETDVALSVLPMFHIYCFTGDYLKNLKDGLQVALNGSLRDIVTNLTLFEPRVMRVVPMIAQTLLRRVKAVLARNPDMEPRDAAKKVFGRNMKWLISGGAYLDPALVEEYEKFGIYLRQGYGMTEAGCRISVPDESAAIDSVGRVIDVCTARIQHGEIQVLTPTKMLGYYKMPEESKAMFTEDGWLKTGDIGYLTPDNQLFITGRVKNLIILSNGENVSPEAIEKKFAHEPIVDEVVVYAEHDRIVAEIYPDFSYIDENGIEDVNAVIESMIDTMNLTAKPSHVISSFKLRSEPFERTGSGKLKRPNASL